MPKISQSEVELDTQLVARNDVLTITEDDIRIVKDIILRDVELTDQEFKMYLRICGMRNVHPLLNQVYCIKDKTGKISIKLSIDGMRAIANRTGMLDGIEVESFDVQKGHPGFSIAKIWKKGCSHPFLATARYSEYVKLNKFGKPNYIWTERPFVMNEKCAEALGLRRGFPEDLSGIYEIDEIAREIDVTTEAERRESPTVPKAARPYARPPALEAERRAESYDSQDPPPSPRRRPARSAELEELHRICTNAFKDLAPNGRVILDCRFQLGKSKLLSQASDADDYKFITCLAQEIAVLISNNVNGNADSIAASIAMLEESASAFMSLSMEGREVLGYQFVLSQGKSLSQASDAEDCKFITEAAMEVAEILTKYSGGDLKLYVDQLKVQVEVALNTPKEVQNGEDEDRF